MAIDVRPEVGAWLREHWVPFGSLNHVEKHLIDTALRLLNERADIFITSYKVKVFESSEMGKLLGYCHAGSLWINRKIFDRGIQEVVSTIFEEWAHDYSCYEDCTREFQSFIIDRLARVVIRSADSDSKKKD